MPLSRDQLRSLAWGLAQAMDEADLARLAQEKQDLADDIARWPQLGELLARFPPAQFEGPSRTRARAEVSRHG